MRSTSWLPNTGRWLGVAVVAVSLLAGCGGDDAPSSGSGPGPSASTTLSGVAAVGAPIVHGDVGFQCFAGTATSATTDANGAWSKSVPTANLPCIVGVTGGTVGGGANTQQFFSIATGSGTSLTVNVTPLSSLVLAGMDADGVGDALFVRHDADAIARLAGVMRTAIAALQTQLAGQGYAVPSGFDPVSGTFEAVGGDAYDDLLEQIGEALGTAGKTYAELFEGYAGNAGYLANIPYGTTDGQSGPIVFGTTGTSIAAADIAPLVGVYHGTLGRDFTPGHDTVDAGACTITVAADGNMTVAANGRSLAAAMNGDVGDQLMSVADMFLAISSDVPNSRYAQVTVTQGYVTSAVARQGGFGFSDATDRLECRVTDPHATTLGTAAPTADIANGATAQDLDGSWAGTYTGGACTVTIDNEARIHVVTDTFDGQAQLGGEEGESINLFPGISAEAVIALDYLSEGKERTFELGRKPSGLDVAVRQTVPRPFVSLASCLGLQKAP